MFLVPLSVKCNPGMPNHCLFSLSFDELKLIIQLKEKSFQVIVIEYSAVSIYTVLLSINLIVSFYNKIFILTLKKTRVCLPFC